MCKRISLPYLHYSNLTIALTLTCIARPIWSFILCDPAAETAHPNRARPWTCAEAPPRLWSARAGRVHHFDSLASVPARWPESGGEQRAGCCRLALLRRARLAGNGRRTPAGPTGRCPRGAESPTPARQPPNRKIDEGESAQGPSTPPAAAVASDVDSLSSSTLRTLRPGESSHESLRLSAAEPRGNSGVGVGDAHPRRGNSPAPAN
jgi:hypothetical protein